MFARKNHFGTETHHTENHFFLFCNRGKISFYSMWNIEINKNYCKILKFSTSEVGFYLLNREFCFIISKFCLYLKLHVSIYKYPHGTVWKCKLKYLFKYFMRGKTNSSVSQSWPVVGIEKYFLSKYFYFRSGWTTHSISCRQY